MRCSDLPNNIGSISELEDIGTCALPATRCWFRDLLKKKELSSGWEVEVDRACCVFEFARGVEEMGEETLRVEVNCFPAR